MITIGTGDCGSKLATLFDKNPLLISTAKQDTINYKEYNIVSFGEDGCGKKYGTGVKLWNSNIEKLENTLSDIVNNKVVIFSSMGGGSGSSSLQFISKILIEQGNKVLIIGVIPYRKEVVPPLANSVQSINSLMPYINDVSIMLFDNQNLIKEFGNDWNAINNNIVEKVNYVVNLIDKHSMDKYSPMTIDKSELESVIFGGGFVDISDNFLEEKAPKFLFSRLDKETKNVLIAMFVDETIEDEKLEEYHNILTNIQSKYASRAKNARFVPGIIRGRVLSSNASDEKINDRAYITIASGLNLDHYSVKIEKIKEDAIEKASVFASKQKARKIVNNKIQKF